MSEQSYNGWTNYPSWCVNLWLNNDAGMYQEVKDMAALLLKEFLAENPEKNQEMLFDEITPADQTIVCRRFAKALKAFCEEMLPDLGASFVSDILGWAMEQVEWYEVAEWILKE